MEIYHHCLYEEKAITSVNAKDGDPASGCDADRALFIRPGMDPTTPEVGLHQPRVVAVPMTES